MTPWLDRCGSGDAPTTAIVRASRRISTGSRPTRAQAIVRAVPDRDPRRLRRSSTSGPDKARERREGATCSSSARPTRARDVVVLPEKWNGVGNADDAARAAEPLDGGETVETMADWARRHDVWLVGGSITERREGRERLSNTCCVFAPGRRARRRLPQDPPLRRRGRRPRLPRVGGRGARRRAGASPRPTAGGSGSRSATTCASRSSTAC